MAKYEFPKDFLFGSASASYQIEGGFDEGGKSEGIWDRFAHIPGNVDDNTSGDVTCDFYHRYVEDIALMKQLGLRVYRMSISWPRVIPDGVGTVNREGIEFYRKVLKCLRDNGIKSAVTIYHWDMPQALQNKGGWANRDIVEWFENYAKVLYKELGDLVDIWITINEIIIAAMNGHWIGEHAPGYHDYSHALLVAHHLLMAHGAAIKAYRQTGLSAQIGCSMNLQMEYPADPSNAQDVEAARFMMMHQNEFYLDAVFKGTYPAQYLETLKQRGITLPDIHESDMELISQGMDFLGINTYFTEYIKHDPERYPVYARAVKTGRQVTDLGWELCPDGFYELLMWVHENYAPKEIIITENGAACNDWINIDDRVEDTHRRDYIKRHLIELNRAMSAGVPITGYFAWCFCDNFEWARGLTTRFGLVFVDYKTQKRTIKDSAYWYADVIRDDGFN